MGVARQSKRDNRPEIYSPLICVFHIFVDDFETGLRSKGRAYQREGPRSDNQDLLSAVNKTRSELNPKQYSKSDHMTYDMTCDMTIQ